MYENAQVIGDAEVSDDAKVFDDARVGSSAGMFGNTRVSKTPINVAKGLRHPITITETHIFIGCEGNTKEYWEENIWEIGKRYGYTEDEILKTIEILSVFN